MFSAIRKNLRYVFLGLALAFLIYGLGREEYWTVFKKAAHICLQCIGIG